MLGINAPFTPQVVLPLAALLFTGAALVTARARLGRTQRQGRLLQAGTVAVACGTGLRSVAGATWACGLRTGLEAGAGVVRTAQHGDTLAMNKLLDILAP